MEINLKKFFKFDIIKKKCICVLVEKKCNYALLFRLNTLTNLVHYIRHET